LIILPISNLMDVPAGTLTGLLTIYFKSQLEIEQDRDNEPEPMPLFSIILVAAERSKSFGKVI
jgi:hypothetical protein